MGILVSRCRRLSRWSCVVPLGARVQMSSAVKIPARRISRCPDVIKAHEKWESRVIKLILWFNEQLIDVLIGRYERGPMPVADVWTKIRPPPPPPPAPEKLSSPEGRKLPTQHHHPLDSISARLSEERNPRWSSHSRTALAPDVLLRVPQNNSCFGYDIRDVDAFLAEVNIH